MLLAAFSALNLGCVQVALPSMARLLQPERNTCRHYSGLKNNIIIWVILIFTVDIVLHIKTVKHSAIESKNANKTLSNIIKNEIISSSVREFYIASLSLI